MPSKLKNILSALILAGGLTAAVAVHAGPCTDAGGVNCYVTCPSGMVELGAMGCGPAYGTTGTKCCGPASETANSGPILPQPTGSGGCPAGYSGNCGNYALNDFVRIGDNVSRWIMGIVGSLSLLMFIYGGFVWLTSAGSSDKVTKGKSIIIGAVIGLVIVFTSYMIIGFVLEKAGYYRGKNWATTPV